MVGSLSSIDLLMYILVTETILNLQLIQMVLVTGMMYITVIVI
nr:MAG TPA: hypothetical protein [Caudoviricetes sp.]